MPPAGTVYQFSVPPLFEGVGVADSCVAVTPWQ